MLRTNLPFSPFAGTALNGLDTLFDRLFGDELDLDRPGWGWGFVPVSMWQDDNNIYVEADLPGVPDKDLEITVHNRVLTIKAQRREEESRKYTFNGRTFGVLERAIVLPDSVDSDQVEAKLANGILSVTLPKHPDARPKKIAVKTS
ncbi:MAG: Hsp20/alpha crystallin family protein [Isosphaeraceae bacterium]